MPARRRYVRRRPTFSRRLTTIRYTPRTGRYATPRRYSTTRRYQRVGFRPAASLVPKMGLALSQCAQEYLKVTLRPFDTNIMPCNLWSPPISSYRQRGFVRGSITAANFNATPECGLLVTSGWCSNVYVGKLSTAAYVSANAMSSFATNISASNFQYAANDFNGVDNIYQWMPVITAVRIRYTGPADQMMGVMYVAEHPSHGDIQNYTVAELATQFYARCVPISNQWTTIVSTGPKNQSELNFQSESGVAPSANTPFYLAITLSGVAAAAQFFQYEIAMYSEVSGSANGTQWSEQDIMGGQRLSQAFEIAGKSLVPELQGRTIYNAVKSTSKGFHYSSRVKYGGSSKLIAAKGTGNAVTIRRSYTPTPSATPTRNTAERIRNAWNAGQRAWNEYGRPAFERARQVYNAANAVSRIISDAEAAAALNELAVEEYIPPPV